METTPAHGRQLTHTASLQTDDAPYSVSGSSGNVSGSNPGGGGGPSSDRDDIIVSGPESGGAGGGPGPSVAFTASVEPPRRGPCMLALQAGQFEPCTMPEGIESLWGPITLPQLPDGVPNTCIVASHR